MKPLARENPDIVSSAQACFIVQIIWTHNLRLPLLLYLFLIAVAVFFYILVDVDKGLKDARRR
jgi:hypothetical protein